MCDQQCCVTLCQHTESVKQTQNHRSKDTGDVFATHMCAVVGVDIRGPAPCPPHTQAHTL